MKAGKKQEAEDHQRQEQQKQHSPHYEQHTPERAASHLIISAGSTIDSSCVNSWSSLEATAGTSDLSTMGAAVKTMMRNTATPAAPAPAVPRDLQLQQQKRKLTACGSDSYGVCTISRDKLEAAVGLSR
jgi:hypothetical protein